VSTRKASIKALQKLVKDLGSLCEINEEDEERDGQGKVGEAKENQGLLYELTRLKLW